MIKNKDESKKKGNDFKMKIYSYSKKIHENLEAESTCSCQLLRSACDWSLGLNPNAPETSIQVLNQLKNYFKFLVSM